MLTGAAIASYPKRQYYMDYQSDVARIETKGS